MKLDDIERGLSALLVEGVWVGDLKMPFFEGVSLRVRRLWNPDYAALYGELAAACAKVDDKLSAADEERITDECLKRTVVCDWRGIDDPFSAEAVERAFASELVRPVFRAAILSAAYKAAAQAKADLETDAKN